MFSATRSARAVPAPWLRLWLCAFVVNLFSAHQVRNVGVGTLDNFEYVVGRVVGHAPADADRHDAVEPQVTFARFIAAMD